MAVRQVTGLASYELPVLLNREIARLIVRWAHYESAVQTFVYSSLGLTVPQGRTAVREPRIIDRLEMLKDLAVINGKALNQTKYKAIHKDSEEIARLRDLVAHSIWARYDGEWHALVTRGTWHDEAVKETGRHPSKRATPESRVVTVAMLRDASKQIERLLVAIRQMAEEADIEPLPVERY